MALELVPPSIASFHNIDIENLIFLKGDIVFKRDFFPVPRLDDSDSVSSGDLLRIN